MPRWHQIEAARRRAEDAEVIQVGFSEDGRPKYERHVPLTECREKGFGGYCRIAAPAQIYCGRRCGGKPENCPDFRPK